jgi:small-conductance mechanosensitive channel/CRP-like cAMP-binding protein
VSAFLASPLGGAVATLLVLELAYLVGLRRGMPRLPDRLRYHLLALATAGFLYGYLSEKTLADSAAQRWLAALSVVLGAETLFRLFDRFALSRIHDARGRAAIPQLVRDLASWIVVGLAIVVAAASFFHWDYGKAALPTAVVSAVLGFALQDILKNVFAGLALQTQQPFDIGDWLFVDGEPRQVLEMSWRATHMRNNLGVEFFEPNANLAVGRVANLGSGLRPVAFAFEVAIGVEAPVARVREALLAAASSAAGVLATPAPQALVKRFGDSGVVYELRVWTTTGVATFSVLRDNVLSRVAARVGREGWRLAMPGRDILMTETETSIRGRAESEAVAATRRLAAVDLFAALAPETRDELARRALRRIFDSGEAIVGEGEPGDSLLVIDRGRVRIAKGDLALATLGPGEFFGEMSLLTGEPRSASAVAETPTEVIVLDRAALAPLLERDPALAETLSRLLAARAASTEERLEHHRGELERARTGRDQASLLKKIRSFFSLG